jgi:hypothetical protein
MRNMDTLLWRLRCGPVKSLSPWLAFWCLCLIATAVFITSFVLSITSSSPTVQFVFALFAILATTALQKFTVLEFVVVLLYRKRSYCAIVVDTVVR